YAALANFLASKRCGVKPADKLLKQADEALTSADWTGKITAYMLGRISADELIGAAAGLAQLTEAHGYVGLCLAEQGQTAAARKHLDWVVQNGIKIYVEYHLALAERQGM